VHPPRDKNDRPALVEAARWSSLGIYMAACIGLCSYLGLLADQKWHTGNVWTLVGFLLGTASAFYGLFKELRRLPKDE
jgi:hypothetical protein